MLKNIGYRQLLVYALMPIALVVAVYLASRLPTADWFDIFDPAARGVFSGLSPYHRPNFNAAPWAVVPLLPIVLFPPTVAHGIMYVTCAALLFYIMWRLKVNLVTAVAFFVSPTAIGALLVNNIDPIVISGMLFPPIWGLFLLVIKPQIAMGVVIYTLGETWRTSGFWGVVRTFAPVTILFLVAIILFPIWPIRMLSLPQNPYNRSTFPYLIPLGLFFLWLAFRHKNPYFALAGSLFFVPYHTLYTYIAFQIGLMHPDVEKYIRRDVLQIALTVFFWAVTLFFKL
jgi:hypothetical protein